MNFNDLIGNNAVKTQLQTLFATNKVPHAILIDGAKGLGKKTLANIIAKTAICSSLSSGLVCENCSNCKKAQKNIHPDIIYPEKSGVLQGYSISTVRQVRANAYISPNEAARKVYIFTDVDNMGIPAQNAILKVLEEPPKNVMFIFTCISPANLLQTVRSRLQQFSLRPVSHVDMLQYLEENCTEKLTKNLSEIVNIANGNIGLALDLLASSDFESIASTANEIAQNIGSPREFDLVTIVSKISEDRKNFAKVLTFLEPILKDALLLASGVNLNKNDASKHLSEKLSPKQILSLIDVVAQTKNYLDKNVSTSISSAYFCSSLYENAFSV